MKFIFIFIALLASISIKAQSFEEEILKKYALYQSIYQQEKVFVQTDRPAYLAGEDLWLSAFVLDVRSQMLKTSNFHF